MNDITAVVDKFEHRLLPHHAGGPPKTSDHRGKSFNDKLAVKITGGVGTMTCAYVFTAIALISLPSVLTTGDAVIIVAWVAQTFLQLVLLSIIIVGQNIAAAASDKRSEATFLDTEALIKLSDEIHYLLERNTQLTEAVNTLMSEVHAKITEQHKVTS